MTKQPALAAVIFAACAAPASADWSGIYAGINVGVEAAVFGYPNSGPPFEEGDGHDTAPSIGMQVGHNWRSGSLIYGIESDFQWTGMDARRFSDYEDHSDWLSEAYTGYKSADTSMPWYVSIRARVGFLPTDNFALYVTSGLSYGRIELQREYYSAIDSSVYPGVEWNELRRHKEHRTAYGWAVGAGTEYAMTKEWSLRAEYVYTNFGIAQMDSFSGIAPDVELSFHSVRIGFNYSF